MKALFYQFTGIVIGLIMGLSVAATVVVAALLYMYYSVSKNPSGTEDKISYKQYRPKPREENSPLFNRVWTNRATAEDFVRDINSKIKENDYFSLLDLKVMLGDTEVDENDQFWGWKSVHGTTYWPMTSGGIKVLLPKIERLKE